METITIIPHYSQHLRNDEVKGTVEYKLWQLNEILGMIAKIKDRKQTHIETCDIVYGKGRGTESDQQKIYFYNRVITRLQKYFNWKLSLLTGFEPLPVKLRNESPKVDNFLSEFANETNTENL